MVQQKWLWLMCALVGKLKEHHFGVQSCSENRYYCWTDHAVQHFRKQLYAARERKQRKGSPCLILQGKHSGSVYPYDLNGCICQKHCLLKNTVLHIRVCGVHTHTSHSSISSCLDTTFVLLPIKTLKGYWSVGNTQVFHSVQFNFFAEPYLFASILALLLLLSSSCSFGDKYIKD